MFRLARWGFVFLDAHYGSVTALATVAIVVLTYVYVTYSKKQWHTMIGANGIAQKTFEVGQQASITLGRKDGVVAEFRNSHSPKIQDGLVIYFQNSGHMQAKFNWGIDEWMTRNPPVPIPGAKGFRPMKRARNKRTGTITDKWSTDGSIGGDAVREVAVGYLPAEFVDSLSQTNKAFEVNGTLNTATNWANTLAGLFR